MEPSRSIGEAPWSRDEAIASLDEFQSLYSERPVKENAGGMRAPHLFATWFMARKLDPEAVVESGIWKGQGTWFLERACPKARIYAIDLNLSKREYVSPSAEYFSIDFCEIDWSRLDAARTLVFFDDHQNAVTRLMQCAWMGFRHVIFEDNNPPGKGDFYTLQHAFSGAGFGSGSAEDKSRHYRSLPSRLSRKIGAVAAGIGGSQVSVIPQYVRDVVAPNPFDAALLKRNLDAYQEFPPVFRPAGTRGDSQPAGHLLEESERDRYPQLFEERSSYNSICYALLRGQAGEGG